MRSATKALLALLGLFATLSVVQAALPSFFFTNPNVADSIQGATSYDAYGNIYYMVDNEGSDQRVLVAVSPSGSKYTGCVSNAAFGSLIGTLGSGVTADHKLAGFTVVADRNFPAAPDATSWLFATLCTSSRCELVRAPIVNPATPTPLSGCPVNWASAAVIGQVVGTWTDPSNNSPNTVTCRKYASTPHVAMTFNPANNAIYIGCQATVGTVSSFVVRTQAMPETALGSGLYTGAFPGFTTAANNVALRITAASSVINSIAVDTYGTLWVVDSGRGSVVAARQFANVLDSPSASTNLGAPAVWTRSTVGGFVRSYNSVAADRSGNVYFCVDSIGSPNTATITVFSGFNLIVAPSATTTPLGWGYFRSGSTFDAAEGANPAGALAYDPFRGRLIFNGASLVSMPLYTVQFGLTTLPTTMFDANGETCSTEGPTCTRVPVMIAGTAASFTLRIAAVTWPSTVPSLPFSANFLASANAVPALPAGISSANFANNPAVTGATSAQIGTTGSILYTFTSLVTITASGATTFAPSFGSNVDITNLFTAIPSSSLLVQGSITAAAQSSTSFPLSSATQLLAGVPNRYQLTLTPTLPSTCTSATLTFSNAAQNIYSNPPTVAGASTVVSFTNNVGSVTYVTQSISAVSWTGVFGGTGAGCTFTFGAAKVPYYAVAVTTTARPAIIVAPINSLISSTPATPTNVEVRLIPGPAVNLAADIAITLKSGTNPTTASTATAGTCTGAFSTASGVIAAAGCSGGAASCAFTGVTFRPNEGTGCTLAAAASTAVVAEVAFPAGLVAPGGSNYWYYNAATPTAAPVQITAAGTINVFTYAAPLSVKMNWAAGVPSSQVVAPGGILGPYRIEYTGAQVSVSFSTSGFTGSYFVLPSTASASDYPTASSAFGAGPFMVSSGSQVFFRAPSTATATILGTSTPADIQITAPAGTTYDATGTPVGITIRLVSTISTTSNPRAAAASLTDPTLKINTAYVWAGTTARTLNTVTLSWGSGLLNAGNAITVFGTSDKAGSKVAFSAVGTLPTLPSGSTLQAVTPGNNAAQVSSCSAAMSGCASISLGSQPIGSSNVTFHVAGGVPTEKISFWIQVVGPDAGFFGFPTVPVAYHFGQVLINSLPTQLSVNVPTFFGVTVEPQAAGLTPLAVADSGSVNIGTFQFCTDITCATSIIGANYDLAQITGAYASAQTVIQYVPPFPQTCSGNDNNFACALGTIPTFTWDLDPTYAIDWTPALAATNRLGVNFNLGKFKLQITGNPPLRGSVAITFVNYDLANSANPPIGVNAGPTTFTYPLSSSASQSSLPLPMVAASKPALNFLAGVRYVVGITMYPPPAASATPVLTVRYLEDNVPSIPASTFSFNRASATANPGVTGAPANNLTHVNIFSATTADFSGNQLDNALKNLGTPITAADSLCPGNSQAAGKCSIGLFWWTVPVHVSGAASNNARLEFNLTGSGVSQYPSQTQTVKISGWCGASPDLTQPIAPTHYGVLSRVNAQCTPALPTGNFLNIHQEYRDTASSLFSQPLFNPTTTPPTGAWVPPAAGSAGTTVGPIASGTQLASGAFFQVLRASVDNSASLGASTATIRYTVITTATPADPAAAEALQSTQHVIIRVFSKIVGTYSVKVSGVAFTAGCEYSPVGYVTDAANLRVPSVSSTSESFGQVCFYPPRAGPAPAGGFPVTVTDGLQVLTNTFTFTALVTAGAGPTDPNVVTAATAGVSGPATAAVIAGSKRGLTLGFTSPPDAAFTGFNFRWNLADAATNVADFFLCDGPAATAASYPAPDNALTATCQASTYPKLPANALATSLLEYRPVAVGASSLASTYVQNRVPISVTMQFKARGMASGTNFNNAGISTFPFIVGETYTIELRTAATLNSPAEAGLTVTLNDLCGALTYAAGQAPALRTSPAAVPARGQWSSPTLFFSPGETTKTVFYTPREICAPITVSGTTTDWGTVFTASVCQDATNLQCADGVAIRFVDPHPVWVPTFGALRVENVPANLPTGVATPSPITVSVEPVIGAPTVIPGFTTTGLIVTASDRYPSTTIIGAGESIGGSFIIGQNTGASATLNFTSGARQAAISYVAPPNSYYTDANNALIKSSGISFVASGASAAFYRIVGQAPSVYNNVASLITAASAGGDSHNFAAPTTNPVAATFGLRLVTEATATGSIEGVYFNVVGGAALAQSTASSLATVSDNISAFVGNANVLPGQSNNAVNFNLPFVSGVPFGYFAAVPFNMSAVVVNVATTANTVFVNNNGWPNAKSSAGSTIGGYILPNALSGYVSPVFFLTPGLNTFHVAAPLGGTADAFTFGAPAGSKDVNPGANGDGIVYRFTIARDTITNFGLFVSANGHANLPWAANLPRLQAQWAAGGNTPSLLTVAPGSGSTQTVFTANVENAVQSVGILAQFYGALKARVSSNNNEFGQILVNIPNNRLVDFQLVAPTNLPGIMSSTTSITLLGGGLGPITINVVRPGKSLIFGATFGATPAASNIENRATGPCVARTATTFGLAVYPSSRSSRTGLTIRGTYTTGSAAPVNLAQAANSPTTTWDLAPQMSNYVSFATLTSAALPVSTLPLTLNLEAVYSAAPVASEYTSLTNYRLDFCPA